ncbi:cytochrome c oxidase subunit II [Billgrantia antri]|uniref:Cytochrome aa3 subunit 2 n=1 Tax=Billgrantia antri TaxID=2846777 RepID=A0ABS6ZNW8_9GAMM|nr:cytochrome c oxidase subunit II [Halomonas antri]MBW6390619.1 cytochrome c oxidase subunit II [Halomonas antri]
MDATYLSPRSWGWRALIALPLLGGCSGPQSTLQPAGVDAEQIARLFWWMSGFAILIWGVVIGCAVFVTYIKPRSHDSRVARWLILGGGVVVPPLVLGVLLAFGLSLLPSLSAPAEDGLQISVSGERWWRRVRYPTPSGGTVELANEVRLPVGERVGFRLTSPDVIHSFWIPSLGGKVDMIPGRTTRLSLEPTEVGVFRGACAEFCGTSHALMNFRVVVMEPDAFDTWLEQQASPARPPQGEVARRGQEAFLANGCGACHAIRGTSADGVLGPDLTHVGSRLSLAAGTLPTDAESFERWISHPDDIKPGVNMPAFDMLPAPQIHSIATYLSQLE